MCVCSLLLVFPQLHKQFMLVVIYCCITLTQIDFIVSRIFAVCVCVFSFEFLFFLFFAFREIENIIMIKQINILIPENVYLRMFSAYMCLVFVLFSLKRKLRKVCGQSAMFCEYYALHI